MRSKITINAGILLQYDIANYSGRKNCSKLFLVLKLSLNYKL